MMTRPLLSRLTVLAAAWLLPLGAALAQQQPTCPTGLPLTTPDSDFQDAGAGMVRHLPTGLVWKRCTEGLTWDNSTHTCTGSAATYTWQAALGRADDVNAGANGTQNLGVTDWRVPNIRELRSMVEWGCYGPAVNTTQFPDSAAASNFWSASPYASFSGGAWGVNFGNGVGSWDGRDDAYQVRLVRAGQSFLNFDARASAAGMSGTAPPGTVGQPYPGFAPTLAPGATQPVAFNASGLPPGLVVDTATGAISGVPSVAGTYPVVLTASNAGGLTTLALSIVVTAPAGAPTAIPTLGEWGVLALSALATALGWLRLRRRRAA